MSTEWSRRHLLGVAGAVAIAGCSGTNDGPGSSDEGNAELSEEEAGDEGASSDDGSSAEEDADGEEEAIFEEYETTEVRVVSSDGSELGAVTAAIADTDERKVRGLSETESLPSDRGMLFVYEEVDERVFVMREMDFGIDIVYADADGTITGLHHAPEPRPDEDGSKQYYAGRGKYVLEVNYDWTTERDVGPGDVLEFDLEE